MKLFKMIGQILESEINVNPIINNNAVNKNSTNSIIQKNINTISNDKSISSKTTIEVNNFYVLFARSHNNLLVINNNNKEEIKIFGIENINIEQSKKCCNYINNLIKKKKVYFDIVSVNNHLEYKIFLNESKTIYLNDLLNEEKLLENKTELTSMTKNKIDNKKENIFIGVFLSSKTEPYLYDNTNSPSYVVNFLNKDKEKQSIWGIDLKRAISEANVQQGEFIEIHNIGPTMVNVNVPVKDKNNKIISYESKLVKKHLWSVKLLEKKAEHQIENKITNTEKEINNCYALFAIEFNEFIGMYKGIKTNFILNNIDTNIDNSLKKELKNYLNLKINKKVIYIKNIDNKVTIFLDSNLTENLNEDIKKIITTKLTNNNILVESNEYSDDKINDENHDNNDDNDHTWSENVVSKKFKINTNLNNLSPKVKNKISFNKK